MKKIILLSSDISTIVAVILWLYSVFQAKVTLFNHGIGDLGLVTILPITFLVSVSLLLFSLILNLKTKRTQTLLFLQTILLICLLSLTPPMIEGTPRFRTTYSNYASVDYITQTGHISPEHQWTQNWPSFSIFSSILLSISVIPALTLLSFYTTLYSIALLFGLFIFFRSITHNEYVTWTAIWIFFVANWVGQDYFSMQSLGLLGFVFIFFAVNKVLTSKAHVRLWGIALLVFFSCVVTSHLLSALMIISVSFVLFFLKRLRRPYLILLLVFVLVSWNIFGASTFLEQNLNQIVTQMLNITNIFQSSVVARIAGSPQHVIITQTRSIYSLCIALFAFFGIMLLWTKRRINHVDKGMFLMLVGILLFGGFYSYGGEIYMRIFFFSLIPVSYFIARSTYSKVFFCIFMLFFVAVAPSLFLIAHYGSESIDYVPTSEIEGVNFVFDKTNSGYIVTESRLFLGYCQSYQYVQFKNTVWQNDLLASSLIKSGYPNSSTYVSISYLAQKYYPYFLGDPSFTKALTDNLTSSVNYNKIYSNPSYEIYLELK